MERHVTPNPHPVHVHTPPTPHPHPSLSTQRYHPWQEKQELASRDSKRMAEMELDAAGLRQLVKLKSNPKPQTPNPNPNPTSQTQPS